MLDPAAGSLPQASPPHPPTPECRPRPRPRLSDTVTAARAGRELPGQPRYSPCPRCGQPFPPSAAPPPPGLRPRPAFRPPARLPVLTATRAVARRLLLRCLLLPARLDSDHPRPQRLLPRAGHLGKLLQGLWSARWIWVSCN